MQNRAEQSQDLQKRLVQTYQWVNQGQLSHAELEIKSLLTHWKNNPQVAHLAALFWKAKGNSNLAIDYFKRSLALDHTQSEVHNNLANLFKTLGEFELAEQHYRQTLDIDKDFSNGHKSLGLCLAAQGKFDPAIQTYRKALELKPSDASVLSAMADSQRLSNQLDVSISTYLQAIKLAPEHLNAWHNKGLSHRLKGEYALALECFETAYKIDPNCANTIHQLALINQHFGNISTSIELLDIAINRDPSNVDHHEFLNELLWESDQQGKFCESYISAIKKHPKHLNLRLSHIRQHLNAGQLIDASRALKEALHRFDASSELLLIKGQIEAASKNFINASHSLSKSIEVKFSAEAAHALTKVWIIQNEYSKAQKLVDKLLETTPNCQLSWSLQSLIWRLNNDERYIWLNYPNLIRSYQLPIPEGYSSLETFLEKLATTLEDKHNNKHAPLRQTLLNGTQTSAGLFNSKEVEIVALKQTLTQLVKHYIDDLPDDPSHPFLSRKNDHFAFSGSWSVRLAEGGFHVNHIHTEGWLSSSFYVSVPTRDEGSLEGAIKFGESPLELRGREKIELSIKPKPGMLVLFPSYYWHGTYPTNSSTQDGKPSYRLTTPFDILPR